MPRLLAGLALASIVAGCSAPADRGGEEPSNQGTSDAGTTTAPDAGSTTTPTAASCDMAAPSSDVARYEALLLCLREGQRTSAQKQAAIAQFVRIVSDGAGFPIVDGNDAIFVYVNSPDFDQEDDAHEDEDYSPDRRREPIRVAGDFDGWGASKATLQPEAEGLYHTRITLPQGPDGVRYKFVGAVAGGGGDAWFSDPLSLRFDFDANGRISLVRGAQDKGHLEWIPTVHATQLNVDRPIYLYVPRGYDQSSERYPVLYMHDGQNLFDAAMPNAAPVSWEADEVAEAEIAAGHASPFVIVGVPNDENRFGEYTHVPDDIGDGPTGGDGAKYADFLVHDLKPIVDQHVRTLTGRKDTAVLGSSLGGLISYQVGALYPQTFRFVGGMSSTFIWGRIGLHNQTMPELYQTLGDLAARDQAFYLDSGGGPGSGCPDHGDSNDNYCETVQMQQVLEAGGVRTYPLDPSADRIEPPTANILHWWEPDAQHNEAAWHARLFRALRFFFRPAGD